MEKVVSMNECEVIVAIASAPATSAIGVVRISGIGSIEMACSRLGLKTQSLKFRHAYYAKLSDHSNSVIDDLVAIFYKGKSSFTGEDSVELFCHGSPWIENKIINLFLEMGAKPAKPGEFSQRAFLNGKMDLSQLEGVAALITSESEQQFLAARQLSSGVFSEYIKQLRQALLSAMAYIEARIDFPDEGETSNLELKAAFEKIKSFRASLFRLVETYPNGKIAKNGYHVVLAGFPNSGKSSLFNLLLGSERAIVTDIAGTTRDFIEENCLLHGRLIKLTDTAGLHETTDIVEKEGIRRSLLAVDQADLIIYLVAATADQIEINSAIQFLNSNQDKNILKIISKCDFKNSNKQYEPDILISVKNKIHIEDLIQKICSEVDKRITSIKEAIVVSNHRHFVCLKEALDTTDKILLNPNSYDECTALDLQEIAFCLEKIIGTLDSEDVLTEIFSNFCLGK